jgi:hypothetical protein
MATHQEQRNGLKNHPTSPYLGIQPRATSQRLHLLVEAIGIYRDDRAPLYLFRFKTALAARAQEESQHH